MLNQIIELSQALIKEKTVMGNSKAFDNAFKIILKHFKGFTVESFDSNGYKSFLVYPQKKRPKKFKIILTGHLDIIPAGEDQYTPKMQGNKLYGAGSMDMKSNLAVLIFLFKEIADTVSYPIALQITTDEEIGGFNGAHYQVKRGVRADFVLAGEPTNFDIVHTAKGVLNLEIVCKGKTAHGAYPWRGDNALLKANNFLNLLYKRFPLPKKESYVTTINLSKIQTNNTAFNKIPEDCTISLDIRFIKGEDSVYLEYIKKNLPKSATLKILAYEPAVFTPRDNMYIQELHTVVRKYSRNKTFIRGAHGTSDIAHFNKHGMAGVEFGPIGDGIGSDHEYIDIKSLEVFYNILKDFLMRLNNQK